MAFYCVVFVFCAIFFGVSCCLFELSMVIKHLKKDLNLINECATTHKNRLLTLNRIGDFINFHSTLKKLSWLCVLCSQFVFNHNNTQVGHLSFSDLLKIFLTFMIT